VRERDRQLLLTGAADAPAPGRWLRAGPARVLFVDGDLRYVRVGDQEIVRRIYLAVRDLNWNTLPGRTTELHVEDRVDSFHITYRRRHVSGDIDFAWTATIDGDPDGVITFAMDGEALAPFAYAKIGLCVHHPIDGFAGQRFTGHTPAGEVAGTLPDTIGPQIHLADGTDLPLFDPVSQLSICHTCGGSVQFAFRGDLWEMEDQRNWTDASYKSASTPASLGYHHVAERGQRIQQSVTVTSEGFGSGRPSDDPVSTVTLGGPLGLSMPAVGLGAAPDAAPLSQAAREALRLLAPQHLRLDVHLNDPDWAQTLKEGLNAADSLGCDLELALFLDKKSTDQAALGELGSRLAVAQARICRVLVFCETEESTSAATLQRARAALGSSVGAALFVTGTNIYFIEMNRHRIPPGPAEGLVWSLNPQIHAFDELSLVENLGAQADTVRTARAFSEGTALFVSPITLRPRFNAVAVTDENIATHAMPRSVDPRQPSLFGAAWTLGSLAALATSGLAAVTYYETVGARGVLAAPVYPLFHVLADAAELAGRPVRAVAVSDPLATSVVAVDDGERLTLLLANLSDHSKTVRIAGLPPGHTSLRVLDETNAHDASGDAAGFRHRRESLPRGAGEVTLALYPYATVRIEVHPS
jgi:hypothetical protein